MMHAFVGAIFLGAVSTLGDYIWAAFQLRHRTGYGLMHGAVICLCVGAVIGWRARRLAAGVIAGPAIGVAAAGLFYILAPFLGYSAMYPAWMFFWCCFALLQEQLDVSRDYRFAMLRGLASALSSAAAFYALGIWTGQSADPPNYLRIFINWSFAFLPGFVALFVGRSVAANELTPVRTSK
jgi:hypothetical protein